MPAAATSVTAAPVSDSLLVSVLKCCPDVHLPVKDLHVLLLSCSRQGSGTEGFAPQEAPAAGGPLKLEGRKLLKKIRETDLPKWRSACNTSSALVLVYCSCFALLSIEHTITLAVFLWHLFVDLSPPTVQRRAEDLRRC